MNYKTEKEIHKRIKEHYEIACTLGYEVIGVFLYGSFNYGEGMSDEYSDIDTKCIVVPTLEDVCLNRKPTSTTYTCDNDEHIEIKDLRLYLANIKKQNVNFVEILFTEYYYVNPKYKEFVDILFNNNEIISHYNIQATLNCICGMAHQKYKALEHPYPTIKDKIEKYGYDGKQLSHIVRLNDFATKFLLGKPYKSCLQASQPNELRLLKRNKSLSLDDTRILSKNTLSKIIDKKENLILSDDMIKKQNIIQKNVDELFNNVILSILKQNFKDEILDINIIL